MFEGLSLPRKNVFAECESNPLDHFIESFFRCCFIAGPGTQVNLNFAGCGKNRGVDAVVFCVDGRDALVHIRFGHARDAKFARHLAHVSRAFCEALGNLAREHCLHFLRRAGQQDDDTAIGFHP